MGNPFLLIYKITSGICFCQQAKGDVHDENQEMNQRGDTLTIIKKSQLISALECILSMCHMVTLSLPFDFHLAEHSRISLKNRGAAPR